MNVLQSPERRATPSALLQFLGTALSQGYERGFVGGGAPVTVAEPHTQCVCHVLIDVSPTTLSNRPGC